MKGIFLRRFDARSDLDFVRQSMTEGISRFLFSYNMGINTFQDFEAWLVKQMRGNFHDFFTVCIDEISNTAGYVYSYDFRPDDLHCRICVYIDPVFHSTGVGAIAVAEFLKIMFTEYPIRKIYFTVFDFNRLSIESILSAGFTEEAVLKEFRYFDGNFHDMHILSVSREEFRRIMEKLL